jgi:hypothetical protein
VKLSTNSLFQRKEQDKRITPHKLSISRTASTDSLKLRSVQSTQILKRNDVGDQSRQPLALSDATNLIIPMKQNFTNHKVQKTCESRSPSPEESLSVWNESDPIPKRQQSVKATSPQKSSQQQSMQIHHLESTLKALSAKLKLSQSIESERNSLQKQLLQERNRCQDLSN